MNILAAIIMSFSVPTNETIEVHIARNIAESGRQEVAGIVTDRLQQPVPCSSRFPSPSCEVLSFRSLDTTYTLTLESVYDSASVSVEVYVVPKSYLRQTDGAYVYQATPGYVYQMEDTSDLVRWRDEGNEFRAPGDAQVWVPNETGITNPHRFRKHQMYRVRVRR